MTDSNFLLTNRACAIAITADISFETALAADFKRKYKNIEFLWKQRPGIGGVAALPPAASQIPGNYLGFLATRATEKRHVDPENIVLSLTRLRDFLVEREVKELSLPVYDPNRGRLHPRELYALIHVIFSETIIQVYLLKKYCLEFRLHTGRRHTKCALCVICLLCYVMCYVIKTLGKKELLTMNNRMMLLGIDPKFGLSILRSNSKILATN